MKSYDEEYHAFVVSRFRTLIRAAMLFGCSRPDAEDAVQDALIRCYAAWPRVVAADDRDAYVYRVLVNGISRSWRRRWRREVPLPELPERALVDPAAGVVLNESVRVALDRLDPGQRQVLVLRYFADLTEAQISQVLGIRPGTVKSRAARAIALLGGDPSLRELDPTPEENR